MDQRTQRDGMAPASALAAALRYGRLAAVLSLLTRSGQETDQHALSLLGMLEPDAAANAELWARLLSQQDVE